MSALTGFGVYKGVKKALDWYSNRKAGKEFERIEKQGIESRLD